MLRLIGWKFWVVTIGGGLSIAVISGLALFDWLGWNPGYWWIRLVPILLGLLVGFFFWKPIWTRVWRWPLIGPWLSRAVFPDLNGKWDVEMKSNWPRIKVMMEAARDSSMERYDAEKHYNSIDLMTVPTFEEAVIDQGWMDVKMTLRRKLGIKDPNAKADNSITIAFDLVRDRAGRAQLAYVFVQENKLDDLASTDVPEFLGAALLTVSNDVAELNGYYFNARNWVRGLNLAGMLTLRKPGKSSKDEQSPRQEAISP